MESLGWGWVGDVVRLFGEGRAGGYPIGREGGAWGRLGATNVRYERQHV